MFFAVVVCARVCRAPHTKVHVPTTPVTSPAYSLLDEDVAGSDQEGEGEQEEEEEEAVEQPTTAPAPMYAASHPPSHTPLKTVANTSRGG